MKNLNKIINYGIIGISLLLAIFTFALNLIPNTSLDSKLEILLYVLPILLLLLNMLYQLKKAKNIEIKEKIKKQALILMFSIYILGLISILFLSNTYRLNYLWDNHKVALFSSENLTMNMNLIPFKTISTLISRLLHSSLNLSIVLENILGNLILFAPFGFFIPMLFSNKIKKLKSFTLLMLISIVLVEVLQYLLRVGQADIDDVILNLSGAVLVYYLMQTKIVKKIINNIFK